MSFFSYPEREQLQTIYGAYLEPVLYKNLKNHPIWGSSSKIYLLAGSMVQVYEQVYIFIYVVLTMSIGSRPKGLPLALAYVDTSDFFPSSLLDFSTWGVAL